ncbi:hypothetical protein G6F50_014037 [Rhizopus delemar]|uniref:Aminoacetone oxidase family FAD-binding enzyme n=1 Tax=Rhizopus delemar TaxID=936053 RepID=A0A9P7C9Q3_9FUNG|nr:hypothetical protein G6F50_014037 [Rhizopus delemar]
MSIIQELLATTDKARLRHVQGIISLWKNALLEPDDAAREAVTPGDVEAANVYRSYAATLAAYQAGDFDDLIRIPALLLASNEEVRTRWQNRVRYLLVDECQAAGVQVRTDCSVQRIEHGSDGFRVHTSHGLFHCASLVVATGGLSIPSMGATGFGYEIARQFGHAVLPTRAGLVPLTLSGKHQERLAELRGVALPIEARCNGKSFQNFMLLTHRGVSGPAILQISSFWQPGDALELDLLPGQDAGEWLRQMKRERPAAELRTVLGEVLPKRLV